MNNCNQLHIEHFTLQVDVSSSLDEVRQQLQQLTTYNLNECTFQIRGMFGLHPFSSLSQLCIVNCGPVLVKVQVIYHADTNQCKVNIMDVIKMKDEEVDRSVREELDPLLPFMHIPTPNTLIMNNGITSTQAPASVGGKQSSTINHRSLVRCNMMKSIMNPMKKGSQIILPIEVNGRDKNSTANIAIKSFVATKRANSRNVVSRSNSAPLNGNNKCQSTRYNKANNDTFHRSRTVVWVASSANENDDDPSRQQMTTILYTCPNTPNSSLHQPRSSHEMTPSSHFLSSSTSSFSSTVNGSSSVKCESSVSGGQGSNSSASELWGHLCQWQSDDHYTHFMASNGIPMNPGEWSRDHVALWVRWAIKEFRLGGQVNADKFNMDGATLVNLTRTQLAHLTEGKHLNNLWTHLQLMRECKAVMVPVGSGCGPYSSGGHLKDSQCTCGNLLNNLGMSSSPPPSSPPTGRSSSRPCPLHPVSLPPSWSHRIVPQPAPKHTLHTVQQPWTQMSTAQMSSNTGIFPLTSPSGSATASVKVTGLRRHSSGSSNVLTSAKGPTQGDKESNTRGATNAAAQILVPRCISVHFKTRNSVATNSNTVFEGKRTTCQAPPPSTPSSTPLSAPPREATASSATGLVKSEDGFLMGGSLMMDQTDGASFIQEYMRCRTDTQIDVITSLGEAMDAQHQLQQQQQRVASPSGTRYLDTNGALHALKSTLAEDPLSSVSSSGSGSHSSNSSSSTAQLWQFLLQLLTDWRCFRIIEWVTDDGEFRFIDCDLVAELWGLRKKKPAMTYEKLTRALRYYYNGDMITKVQGKAFHYKFVCDLKYLLGYSAGDLRTLVMGCVMKHGLLPLIRIRPLPSAAGAATHSTGPTSATSAVVPAVLYVQPRAMLAPSSVSTGIVETREGKSSSSWPLQDPYQGQSQEHSHQSPSLARTNNFYFDPQDLNQFVPSTPRSFAVDESSGMCLSDSAHHHHHHHQQHHDESLSTWPCFSLSMSECERERGDSIGHHGSCEVHDDDDVELSSTVGLSLLEANTSQEVEADAAAAAAEMECKLASYLYGDGGLLMSDRDLLATFSKPSSSTEATDGGNVSGVTHDEELPGGRMDDLQDVLEEDVLRYIIHEVEPLDACVDFHHLAPIGLLRPDLHDS